MCLIHNNFDLLSVTSSLVLSISLSSLCYQETVWSVFELQVEHGHTAMTCFSFEQSSEVLTFRRQGQVVLIKMGIFYLGL